MSRSNSAIIYLIVAALVLIAGIWGLNQAGILSIGGKQPTTAPAAAVQEPVKQTDTANNSAAGGQAATEAVTSTTETGAATGTNSDSNAAAQPASGGQVAADASTAARIIARGKLVVGVRDNLAKFAQTDANGERGGADIEIAHELAKRWLGDPSLIEFVTINAANQIPTLVNGDVDLLIAAIAATRDRAQLVDFSQAYHVSHNMLIVRNETIINGLRGLQDKQVAVVEDGSDIEVITGLIASESLSITVATQSSFTTAAEALKSGAVEGILLNHLQYEEYFEAQAVEGFRAVQLSESSELIAVALRKNESALRNFVNSTLQDIEQDGTLATIYQKWMPTEPLPTFEYFVGESKINALSDLPSQLSQPATSRMDEVIARNKIIAGVVPGKSPFVVEQEGGKLGGFDISLLEEMSHHWFGTEDGFEVLTGSEDELLNKLSGGEIDLILGGVTPQRQWIDRVDFSQAYSGPPVISKHIAAILPQNDSAFRAQVNYLIQDLESSGEFKNIYKTWFGVGSIQYQVELMAGSPETVIISQVAQDAHAALNAEANVFVESALGRIRKRNNQLIAGVRFNTKPFGFLDENGQVSGFDIDLINAIAEDWGVTVSFVQVNESTANELINAGQVDLATAGAPIGKEKLAEVDYSQSYFIDGDSLLIKRYAGITGIQDMDGKTVGVTQGSGFDAQVLAYAETQKVNISVVPFNDFNAMVEAVKAGQVDAITAETSLLRQAVLDNPDLAVAGRAFTQDWFGMVLPPGDSNFKNLVDASLQKLKQSGKYDELYKKWFGRTTTPYAVEVYPGQWPYTFADSPSVIDSPGRSKVEQMLLKKKLVVGIQYDAAPFGFLDSEGQLAGFDIDLAREFASRWLGDAESIQPVRVSSQGSVELLASGELDILFASLIHSWEQEPTIDFSQSYVVDSQRLLVRASDTISNVADLGGRTVAVINGSAAEKNLTEMAEKLGVVFDIVPFQELPAAVAALAANQVDAVTGGELALASYSVQYPDLIVAGDALSAQPLSIGVPNYDKRFHDLVNFTLQEMKQDGSYNRIFAKWFGKSVSPANIEVWEGESYLRGVNLIPMRRIPAGEFTMGFDKGFPDEGPAKAVNLETFYMDQYEVTNRQYAQCVTDGKCGIPSIPRSVNFAAYYGESDFGNYPVIWVTWQDASTYCAYAGKRLPTEAEWEKSARGTEGRIYPWGDAQPDKQTNFGYLEKDVTSVGKYSEDVSAYGVFDMAGNVREWVSDWYQWNYYQSAPAENPAGPRNGVTRVLRGAGWNDTADQLRLTLRRNFLADSFDSNLGFRCASTEFPPGQ